MTASPRISVRTFKVPRVTPTPQQQDVLDVVCTLTNLLMKDMKRGSGQTTLRQLIANRILDEDEMT